MKYDIEVLKKMLIHYTEQLRSLTMMLNKALLFPNQPGTAIQQYERRIAQCVMQRRNVAAIIENDSKEFTKHSVTVDSMLYASCAGADTSHWG